MNLEELKYLWQGQDQNLMDKRLDEQALRDLLEKRSLTTLGKINRNIFLEMAVVALFGLFWLWGLLQNPGGPNTGQVLAIFLYVLLSAAFYAYKYRSLNRVSLRTVDLHTSLTRLVEVMGRFMRLYFWGGLFLAPFLGTAGFLAGLYSGISQEGKTLTDLGLKQWLIILTILVVFNALAIWMVRLYIRWVYGQHFHALKSCLAELEEEVIE